MTDLTVLHAPNALFPTQSTSLGLGFTFQHRSSQFTATPMVTLSTEDLNSPTSSSSDPHSPPAELRPHAPQPQHVVDDTHLSPPTNTFTSRPPRRRPSLGQRPSSAPPTTTRYTNRRGSVDVFEQPVLSPRTPRTRGVNYARSRGEPELIKPPPPLFRPKTFWRHTTRSGVTSSSYSPSSHLIRRSTFIAAGLDLDRPRADLSALGVESRIGLVILPPS
ncbi:uncharacterized protein STEHIDRAFT_158468 [Stereum hirsutum FP-91666 SS1]|uniref:uncharacterized protein n=1 Tax=Stereum hirsutum (strain FP-91666) TaxID=721885 RepID=UPI00044495BB|nr:uncharacterized protein STEHIDRAFT_158468 [Stereum hirsutum FP-91666 SS1]EIM84754.1 hypothetical protein STEHIDRAFT_158468 [Stereum hirsutum FP-91666 SS1]